jgi:hypothetical protein
VFLFILIETAFMSPVTRSMLPEIFRAVSSVSWEPSKKIVVSSDEVILSGKSKPATVRAVKLMMMPIEVGSGLPAGIVMSVDPGGIDMSVAVPLHASVSVVSAACAFIDKQVTIVMRAMIREHVRSMEKPNQSNPCNNVPHSWGADYPRCQLLASAAIAASRVAS